MIGIRIYRCLKGVNNRKGGGVKLQLSVRPFMCCSQTATYPHPLLLRKWKNHRGLDSCCTSGRLRVAVGPRADSTTVLLKFVRYSYSFFSPHGVTHRQINDSCLESVQPVSAIRRCLSQLRLLALCDSLKKHAWSARRSAMLLF